MTVLELPYLMNVLLYIDDILSIQNFMMVSKKCPLSALSLKINPFIFFQVQNDFYYFQRTKYMPRTAEKFIDRLFLLFPNIQTLHLYHSNVNSLTDSQIEKIDRILLSHDRKTPNWYYGNTNSDEKHCSKVVNFKGDPKNFEFNRLERIYIYPNCLGCKQLNAPSLKRVTIFKRDNKPFTETQRNQILSLIKRNVDIHFCFDNEWSNSSPHQKQYLYSHLKQLREDFPTAYFTVKYHSSVSLTTTVALLPNYPVDYLSDISNETKEMFSLLSVPFDLEVQRSGYDRNIVTNDFSCFNYLTRLNYSRHYGKELLTLPTSLKELRIIDRDPFGNIANIKESEVTKFEIGAYSCSKITLPTKLKALVIENRLITNIKCPEFLESLSINCSLGYKKVTLNDTLKELKINSLTTVPKIPKTLTSLTISLIKETIHAHALKQLTVENQRSISAIDIPKTVTSLTLLGTESCSLSSSTHLKELYMNVIADKQGKINLNPLVLPSNKLSKLTVWIEDSSKLDNDPFIWLDAVKQTYGDSAEDIIVDGSFVNEIRGF
ncbi:Uncharacterized protein QTN25_005530 [Entamoeba marina]